MNRCRKLMFDAIFESRMAISDSEKRLKTHAIWASGVRVVPDCSGLSWLGCAGLCRVVSVGARIVPGYFRLCRVVPRVCWVVSRLCLVVVPVGTRVLPVGARVALDCAGWCQLCRLCRVEPDCAGWRSGCAGWCQLCPGCAGLSPGCVGLCRVVLRLCPSFFRVVPRLCRIVPVDAK